MSVALRRWCHAVFTGVDWIRQEEEVEAPPFDPEDKFQLWAMAELGRRRWVDMDLPTGWKCYCDASPRAAPTLACCDRLLAGPTGTIIHISRLVCDKPECQDRCDRELDTFQDRSISSSARVMRSDDCSVCHAMSPFGKPFPTCSRCHKRRYCSRECQKKDWPQHKASCKQS